MHMHIYIGIPKYLQSIICHSIVQTKIYKYIWFDLIVRDLECGKRSCALEEFDPSLLFSYFSEEKRLIEPMYSQFSRLNFHQLDSTK